MRRVHVLALVLGSLMILVGAGPLPYGGRGADYGAALGGARQVMRVHSGANTVLTMHQTSQVATPACFSWGSLVVVDARTADVGCCFAMTSTYTLGALSGQSAFYLTDSANAATSGDCAGLLVQAGQKQDYVVKFQTLYSSAGARAGLCTNPTRSPLNEIVYSGCLVDADCIDAGAPAGTTCQSSAVVEASDALIARRQNLGCAFARCQMSAAGGQGYRVEQ